VTPEVRRVRTSGGELSVLDAGEGPPVVLIHGFPQSSLVWTDLAGLLAGRFRVIAPDLLGAGESDRPAGAPLDLAAQTRYVTELLEELGVERVAAVGSGFGGGVAQRLALESRADALVLLNPVVDGYWPAEVTRTLQDAPEELRAPGAVPAAIRSAFDLGMGHRTRLTDDRLAAYVRPFERREGMEAFVRWVRALDGTGLERSAEDLGQLEIPVLILWGEDDPFFPVAAAEQLNEWIATSSLGLLPGCGHFVLDDAIDTIGPMIYEYLRARYLGAPHGHGADPTGAVMIQLERRPAWVDLAEVEDDDEDDGDDDEGSDA
jgi:pimeloyl-ACP methyl ester carboxylesterase